MKTVLITGVTGFIGRHVVHRFVREGWQVAGLDKFSPELSLQKTLSRYDQIDLPSGALGKVLEQVRPQACIHCAGPSSVDLSMTGPSQDFNASVLVTFNLLETLRLHAPECHLIYLSSAAVYGNPKSLPIDETHEPHPISPYGFHKWIGEQLCMEFSNVYHLPTSIVRIFSAYGVGLKRQVLWDICRRAMTEPRLRLRGTGRESRDFINVQDVAKAISILAPRTSPRAEIYNLASGTETTIRELAERIIAKLEQPIPIEFDGTITPGNPLNWRADISRINHVGFHPEIGLEKGVKDYAQWCRTEVMGR